MKNCLFCGTFNPVHNAHLRVADYVLKEFGFEKVIFIPSCLPPHKEVSGCTAQDRFNMVKLAVAENIHYIVSGVEFNLAGKSYTYNTILKLNEMYGNSEKWPFIIGTDAFKEIKSWYKTDELKKLLKFIVFGREYSLNSEYFEDLRSLGYDFEFTNLDFCDISSTDIRNKVKNGEDISKLVPLEVKNYIYENGLYR